MKQQYNTIDILKFFASIGVVAIHVAPISEVHKILCEGISFLISFCVPLFFIMSSFLFFSNITPPDSQYRLPNVKTPEEKLYHFVQRISILYFVWMGIQIVLTPARCADWFNWDFPLKVIFGTTFGGSWFYAALVISVSIAFFFRKKHKALFTISIISYLIFVLGKCGIPLFCNIYDWYGENLTSMFLSWPYAMLWVFTGFCLSSQHGLKETIGISLLLALILVPLNLIYGNCISWVLRYVCVTAIAILCCRYNCSLNLPYKWLRKTSTLVFMIHFYFVYLLPEQGFLFGFISVKFLEVLSLSILMSSVIIEMAKTNKMKFLKYLY